MKTLKFSPRFLIINGRWRPEMSNYYSHIKNNNVVVFEAVKTRYFLNKALHFMRKMGASLVPFCIVDIKASWLQAYLDKVNKHLFYSINVLYKWPSGMLTNYFIALPSITNVILRLGIERGLKRKVSQFFPKKLPGFVINGNYLQDTALREFNLFSLPNISFIPSYLQYRNDFITFPILFNVKKDSFRFLHYMLLLSAYVEGFLHNTVSKCRKKGLKKNRIKGVLGQKGRVLKEKCKNKLSKPLKVKKVDSQKIKSNLNKNISKVTKIRNVFDKQHASQKQKLKSKINRHKLRILKVKKQKLIAKKILKKKLRRDLLFASTALKNIEKFLKKPRRYWKFFNRKFPLWHLYNKKR